MRSSCDHNADTCERTHLPNLAENSTGTTAPKLNRKRPLSSSGADLLWGENFGDLMLKAQAPQPGRCKHDRVVLSFFQFAEPCIHIPADWLNLQVRSEPKELCFAALRACTNARML